MTVTAGRIVPPLHRHIAAMRTRSRSRILTDVYVTASGKIALIKGIVGSHRRHEVAHVL
jgi:hypothetical protein